ncbi:MAG: endonuclease III [Lentimicrobium sp.]|uniref:endonuclease III n=1 Tax=Lentimicrobium sp. TaxID=2034841 RepID=UPI0025EC4F62|nr:endonuclease III [Lentimicrobium sp.]MCO5257143.1 endonuclease III [Lentimicrobium sp.]MCO5262811.1 endonuclease III [Lentimicrobium sp.]
MSRLSKPERFKAVIGWFEQNMPVAETELHYDNPYELIVAVILSAQCTDKRVNMITPPFFRRYPDAEALAAAEVEDIFELIRSCSYPNNKAKHLSGMARMLVNDFGGVVPGDVETLQRLPGVGRKTANVIASVAFNMPAMAVDTHVHRVSARIGLTYRAKNPLETERQLVKYIPESKLAIAHHWLILHGRYVCIARKPKCSECGLREWCRYYQTKAQDAPRKDAMTQ